MCHVPSRAQFFVNLSREAYSEIAALATIRTIKMHAKLAEVGDEVSTVFFVFRGECISRTGKREEHEQQQQQQQQQHPKRTGAEAQQRYGPGHIIGW